MALISSDTFEIKLNSRFVRKDSPTTFMRVVEVGTGYFLAEVYEQHLEDFGLYGGPFFYNLSTINWDKWDEVKI